MVQLHSSIGDFMKNETNARLMKFYNDKIINCTRLLVELRKNSNQKNSALHLDSLRNIYCSGKIPLPRALISNRNSNGK